MIPEPKSILVIRRDNIGDLLCTTPLFRTLRNHFPSTRISALVNSYNAPALRGNPDLDVVLVYEKAKHRTSNQSYWRWLAGRFWVMRTLRHGQYDLVLIPSAGDTANALKFAKLTSAKAIVGYHLPSGVGRYISVPAAPEGTHEVEAVSHLLSILNIDEPPPAMVLAPDPTIVREMLARIPTLSRETSSWIGLHISARKPQQRWPVERFAALAREFIARGTDRILVFWAPGAANDPLHPGDDNKAQELRTILEGLPISFLETTQLEELIAGLSLCDRVICADGGAMHIASALGKSIVCLFGNSDARRWHPWGVPYELLQKPGRNVVDISVAEVLDANEKLSARTDRLQEA